MVMRRYTILEGLIPTPRRFRDEKALAERAWHLLELVNLTDRANEKSKNLPYGHQRRLEIARALAQNPKLLLLDEPAAGMNPDETQQLMDFIEQIHEQLSPDYSVDRTSHGSGDGSGGRYRRSGLWAYNRPRRP